MSADLPALNKQAIQAAKRHMNQVAWPTVLLAAVVLVVFICDRVMRAKVPKTIVTREFKSFQVPNKLRTN